MFFFLSLWDFGHGWCDGCVFCMQECAKATLNMKDCQMTDRTTQTEHMGPEVRHKENTRSVRNTKAHLTQVLSESFLDSMFLLSFAVSGNTLYTQPQLPILVSHHLKRSHFSDCTKDLICQTIVHLSDIHVVFWQPVPNFTVWRKDAELHLTYLTFWVDTASLCLAGADSMRTQQN